MTRLGKKKHLKEIVDANEKREEKYRNSKRHKEFCILKKARE